MAKKASDVKDTSLSVPSSVYGTVIIDVRVYTRDGIEKDERSKDIEKEQIELAKKDIADQLRIYEDDILFRVKNLILIRFRKVQLIKKVKKLLKLFRFLIKIIGLISE